MRPPGWLSRRDRIRLRRSGAELSRALLDCLCPPTCAACDRPGSLLCAACGDRLQRRPAPACPRCGAALLVAGARCAADHRPLVGLAWLRSPYRYAGTGGALVRRLKFRADPGAARLLCRAMAAQLREGLSGGWRRAVLVPVPLHRSRLRERGLDQAARLAEGLEASLGLLYLPRSLDRIRATLPQGDPRVTHRERNVAGAFTVRRPRAVRDRRVILVDDTFTSGSTARECARVLRSSGARAVAAVTATRARD